MYALVQRVIGSTKVTVARPAVSSSKVRFALITMTS
jgi:hypothetical protein